MILANPSPDAKVQILESYHLKHLLESVSNVNIIMSIARVAKSSGRSMRQGTKVALPTGEIISKNQHKRRIRIPDFPVTTEHLPAGIQTEDIIKQWPNHLVSIHCTHT